MGDALDRLHRGPRDCRHVTPARNAGQIGSTSGPILEVGYAPTLHCRRMLPLIAAAAAASIIVSEPASQSIGAEPGSFLRVLGRPAMVNAEEWKRATPERKRRERLIQDERGKLQLQRLFEYE